MLTIRRAAAADQPQLMAIYRTAQEYMLQTGNPTQWGRSYPSPELIRSDIAQGICRVLSDEAGIHGVFALLDTPEPTYSRIEGAWRNDAPYLTIHRLAGDGRTHGLFRCAADYCKAISRNVRADTHADNRTMQHLLEENGFLLRCVFTSKNRLFSLLKNAKCKKEAKYEIKRIFGRNHSFTLVRYKGAMNILRMHLNF